MKKQLSDLLGSLAGYRVKRPKPKPKVRFVKEPVPRFSRLLRFSYFYDLCSRSASIPGNIVECGVGKGESLLFLAISSFILSPNKIIYAFDSFKGLPSLTMEDKPELLPDGMKEGSHSWSKESVIDYLLAGGLEKEFIDKKIRFIEGYFSESLTKYPKEDISMLHIDVDLYESYKVVLNNLYPFVVTGGTIAFDEYKNPTKYMGAQQAIDEFLENKTEKPVRGESWDRYYVVKK